MEPAGIWELEGTWEEVAAHAPELAGKRVRLTVMAAQAVDPEVEPKPAPAFREASGRSLLRHAGTWVGDDLEECLEIVRSTRGPAEFRPSVFDSDEN
jgi:hypothetical protein